MTSRKEMEMKNNGRKSSLANVRVVDSDSIRELQERIRRQAEESLELREGCSIKELLQHLGCL